MSTVVVPPEGGKLQLRTEFSMHLETMGSLPFALALETCPDPLMTTRQVTFTLDWLLPPRSQQVRLTPAACDRTTPSMASLLSEEPPP